jgi:hypothetical protein
MVALVDRRSNFWNRSDENDVNRGVNSKLTSEQIEERHRLHAMRLAYGKPTIQEIVEHWFDKYGITLHYNSEKEWAWRNESAIIDTLNRMVDNGEIKLQLTDNSLVQTLSISGNDTAKLVKTIENHFQSLMKHVDFDFDPYKKVGISELELENLDETTRKQWQHKIEVEAKMNKFRLAALKDVSGILAEHKLLLIKTVEATKDLFDDTKIKEKKFERDMDNRIKNAVEATKQGLDFDPMMEITDAMREPPKKRPPKKTE